MWDWLADLLFIGATEDAARRGPRYRQKVERVIVAVCVVAVVGFVIALLIRLERRL